MLSRWRCGKEGREECCPEGGVEEGAGENVLEVVFSQCWAGNGSGISRLREASIQEWLYVKGLPWWRDCRGAVKKLPSRVPERNLPGKREAAWNLGQAASFTIYLCVRYFIFLHTQTMYAATNGMAADTYAMTFNVNRLEELL